VSGRPHRTLGTNHVFAAEYVERAGKMFARVDYNVVVNKLMKIGVKPNWNLEVQVEYPVRAS
jgi:hypothetical protein